MASCSRDTLFSSLGLRGSEESQGSYERGVCNRSHSHRVRGGARGINTFLSPNSPSTSHWSILTRKPEARKAGVGVWFLVARLSTGQRSVENEGGAGAGGTVRQPLGSSQQLLGQLSTITYIWLVRRQGAQMDLGHQLLTTQQAA